MVAWKWRRLLWPLTYARLWLYYQFMKRIYWPQAMTPYRWWRRLVWLPTYVRAALHYHMWGMLRLWWDRR